MARYIDADLLKADLKESEKRLRELYKGLKFDDEKQICAGQITTFVECILRIKGMPTADVVEVVRCKDCLECKFDLPTRENGKSALDGWYCKLNREYVNPDAFCSYGKRKEGVE